MVVVGYLYNNNGMSTWCLETAFALHEAGKDVILIHAPHIQLPNNLPFKILTVEVDFHKKEQRKKSLFFKKLITFFNIFSSTSCGFSFYIFNLLTQQNEKIESFFLNQSNMLDKRTPVPQYVCSWVYPFTVRYYIKTAFLSLERGDFKSIVLTMVSAIGFYRKDKAAFRAATRIFALTPDMKENLVEKNFKAILLSPCCKVEHNLELENSRNLDKKIRVILCALDLSSKRKNLVWIMQKLNSFNKKELEIFLIGNMGKDMEEVASKSPHTIVQKGILQREEFVEQCASGDIFLFGSLSDDWGYVLTEAMSQGLAILAPAQHPFNYIIGKSDYLFSSNSGTSFLLKFEQLVNNYTSLYEAKNHCYNRVKQYFSREQYIIEGKKLQIL